MLYFIDICSTNSFLKLFLICLYCFIDIVLVLFTNYYMLGVVWDACFSTPYSSTFCCTLLFPYLFLFTLLCFPKVIPSAFVYVVSTLIAKSYCNGLLKLFKLLLLVNTS